MFRHVFHGSSHQNKVALITAPDLPPFTIPSGEYLQSILRVTNAKRIGAGSSGIIYSAVMTDLMGTECVVKLHKRLMDKKLMYIDKGVILRDASIADPMHNEDFKDVIDEFKQEIDFSIRLTLGWKVFDLHITEASTAPVPLGLWRQAQTHMQAQLKKPGHDCIHHILEFDLYHIPCIVSKRCTGDLLHLVDAFPLASQEILGTWKTLLSQIHRGVCFMHNENVAHNDLKPANVFYLHNNDNNNKHHQHTCFQFQALVADFGMSTLANKPLQVDFGTQAYACPELQLAFERKKKHKAYLLSKASTQRASSASASAKEDPLPLTVPMHNDAFAFAKTGLVLLVKFQNPSIVEKEIIKQVNAQINATAEAQVLDPVQASLLRICRATPAHTRYALFQQFTTQGSAQELQVQSI